MAETTIRGIAFDKDGTLIDFGRTWPRAFRASTTKLAGLAGRPELVDQLLDAGGQDPATDRVRPGTLLAEGTTSALVAHWQAVFGAALTGLAPHANGDLAGFMVGFLEREWAAITLEHSIPVTDLPPLFDGFRRDGLKLGIVTNDTEAMAWATARRHGVDGHLAAAFGYDSGHGAKPDPGMILAFAAASGLPAGAIAMVGDSPADLLAGRAAGCGLVVAVLSGTAGRAELEPLADSVLGDIAALPALLAGRDR